MQQTITHAPAAPSPASILIAADEASVARDLMRQLESIGYRVIGAVAGGEEAIMLAREKKPSLVLVDILLTGPMDGIETAKHIGRGFNIPVVFLISSSDPATIRRATEATPYGYLTKSFQIKELRASVEVALYKSRLERQLRESEQWFAATLRCVGDAVIATDTKARITYLNPVAEALTGWAMEEARGREVEQVLRLTTAGASGAPISSPSRRALRENMVVGIEHGAHLVSHDGVLVPVDHFAAPLRGDDGGLLGAVVVVRDVSERLRQEERLRANDERARLFFDLAPSGMALVALDGRFLQVTGQDARL